MKILIQGANHADEVPGIERLPQNLEVAYAGDSAAVAEQLPGTDIFLAWNFRNSDLQKHWDKAVDLKWIHWCGAGVDAALFDELVSSEVLLTNAQGIFDLAMAETVLAYMLFSAKDFKTTLQHQDAKKWEYRMTRRLQGSGALIIGVGSIGREFARLLTANGVDCYGAGRSARTGDAQFREIYDSSRIDDVIGQFDWVIGIMPSTSETEGFFNARIFSAMSPAAHFISMGRGNAVVESELLSALENGEIAGAMLDVFCNEPLLPTDPIWNGKNLFISPHISGDYRGFEEDMVNQFVDNLERYISGSSLKNVVDKHLGFVKSN